jgi:polyhydroxybutyrate depolymerase
MQKITLFLLCVLNMTWAHAEQLEPVVTTWTVGELTREALVAVPQDQENVLRPLIFAFHGHGGNMRHAERNFPYHKLWPQALVIFPQGIPTPGKLTDPEGEENGWQSGPGDHGDRDLLFFDAMLKTMLTQYRADPARIYATGHSNGGGFTYLLAATRPTIFAAIAPSGAFIKSVRTLPPTATFHVAGEQDPLVKFAWQQLTFAVIKKNNHCGEGRAWGNHAWCTEYPSALGKPLITCIHPGGHKFPDEAPPLITQFFQQQRRELVPVTDK